MEKRKPHYQLADIKAQFRDPDGFRATTGAQDFAYNVLKLTREELIELVLNVDRSHFYKSMTSYRNHQIWQDVYHVPFDDLVLYVKFTKSFDDFYMLIALKEK